ncbi:uncharacterized protein [Primulina eburnea]|uniref:uncharacterized protein n=1 Tax=Primulina eburnea TaxID=1245227 RepID=UPI003C6BF364
MDTSLANVALRPPVIYRTNYSLWKVKIRYYIKFIDERAWQCVINVWTSRIMIDQDGHSLPKPETDWTADEVQNSNYNSQALNAIFTSVEMNMFSLITNCTFAKSAWDTLQRHCEDSESVRRTRLRMLTSNFEMMRMEESENILDYDRRLREIANEAFSLGDPISNERLVIKVLPSLVERFNIKICTIDEAKDISQMTLEDLISSLRTFEMNMDMQKKYKGNTIAFQVSNDSYDDLLQISQEANESDLCEDSIAYITKKFRDYLKRIIDKKARQPSKFPSLPALERPQTFPAKQQFQPINEENRLQRVNPLGVATPGHNICEKSICLKSTASSNSSVDYELENDDEEVTLDSVQKHYEELFADWTKRNQLNSTFMKENTELKAVVAKFEIILSKKNLELGNTKEELQKATETLYKFNLCTSKLDSILLMGRDDKKGLGFKHSVFEIGHWYFYSGSSRHMTGSRKYLIDYVEQKCGRVTYGGGAKGKIVGKRTLNVEGLPKLHNVLHVEGLNSNLISISQLCDDNFLVKFDKHTCKVFDEDNMCIMTDLEKKTAEDDVEDLLENPISLEDADVAPDVSTSGTTRDTEVTESEEETHSDDDALDDGPNVQRKIQKNHPSSQIIGNIFSCFISDFEPKNVDEALKDEFWINAMHDELEQFVRNDLWNLVPPPDHGNINGTKWIFKNKTDESGKIIRNKARLVAQGYTQG